MTRIPELKALTGMRGLAAWAVVVFHARQWIAGVSHGMMHIIDKFYLAVDFFFILSGMVIWLSYGDRLRAEGLRSVPGFLMRRIGRIWPLHLFILSGTVALAVLLTLANHPDPMSFPARELPLHFFLLQNWGWTNRLSWNVPAWSISCELAAYLAFPLLVMAIDWKRLKTWQLIAVPFAMFCGLHLYMAHHGYATLGSEIEHVGLVRCLFEFGAGTAIGALYLRFRVAPRVPMMFATLSGAVFGGLWLFGPMAESFGAPACFSALVLALALSSGRPGHPLEHPVIYRLGVISFSTYLVHFIMFKVVKLMAISEHGGASPSVMAAYLVAVWIMSEGLYRFIELPGQRLFAWRPKRVTAEPATA